MKKNFLFLFAFVFVIGIAGTSNAAVLEIDGVPMTLGGDWSYDSVTITNGGTLYVDGWLNLVSDSIYVEAGSSIDGTAMAGSTGGSGGAGGSPGTPGDADSAGDGQNGTNAAYPGGRGGDGGVAADDWGENGGGGLGGQSPGIVIGDATARYDYTLTGAPGGGGGGGAGGAGSTSGAPGTNGSDGESGGATVRLAAPQIDIYGSIFVDGGSGGHGGDGGIGVDGIFDRYNQGGGAGGGAGANAGMIFLDGTDIDISGATLSAIGGDGGLGGSPGGLPGEQGADGRIKMFYIDTFLDTGTTYHYGTLHTEAVPIPGAVWLLGSGLIGIVGIRRKLKS